jgi:hypothetical protein
MVGGGLVRRGGHLMRVPAAYRTRTIDFGEGPVNAVTIRWGNVVTAYYSTGIPDIEDYMGASFSMRVGMRLSRYAGWLLGSRPVQKWFERRVRAGPPGASADERQRGRSLLGRGDRRRRRARSHTLAWSTGIRSDRAGGAGDCAPPPRRGGATRLANASDCIRSRLVLEVGGVIREDVS